MEKKVELGVLSRIREKITRKNYDEFEYCRLEWNDRQQGWHYNFKGDDERAYKNGWVIIFEKHISYADLFVDYIDNKRNYYTTNKNHIKKIYANEIIEEWKEFERLLKMLNEKGFIIYQKHRNFYL